jgi:hypothetical protein
MSDTEKDDLSAVFSSTAIQWKSLDYVLGWFWKAREMSVNSGSCAAFVATNSICQGQQVPAFWKYALDGHFDISFARTSFKWKNLATKNATVTVVVVGMCVRPTNIRLYDEIEGQDPVERRVSFIGPYLVQTHVPSLKSRASPSMGCHRWITAASQRMAAVSSSKRRTMS